MRFKLSNVAIEGFEPGHFMLGTNVKSGLDCHVLVLNKHYMAVSIIRAKRAFSLLFQEHAEVISVEKGNYSSHDFQSWREVSSYRRQFESEAHDWVSAVNFYIAVPRIIRLLCYDRLPGTGVKFNRRNIFARDRNRCQYCGKKFISSELSLDHVIPRMFGGKAEWGNIVCACTKCNAQKGGRTPKEAGMQLISEPVKPKHNALIHIHLSDSIYRSWEQFLEHAYWSVELK